MNESRLNDILAAMPEHKVAIIGDFCVDRYLHIDPDLRDTAKETGFRAQLQLTEFVVIDNVVAHMKGSKGPEDWGKRCEEVKAANGDDYPPGWYQHIILARIPDNLGLDTSIRIDTL